MDRRGVASYRGRSSARGQGWRGRGRSGDSRPSPRPPPSTVSSAAVTSTPAVTVDDAAPIVGTCPDMCPARERAQRERLRDIAVFERVGGDPARTSPSLAVKKFCRTISSTNVQSSDIRPLPVLRETMDYLLHILDSSELPYEAIHDFIFDRTRSIRQDLSMQNIVNGQAIQIYEDVVTFHIRSHQRLAKSCQDSDASSLCFLNMEQLTKCLLSLFDMYHVIYKSNPHSNKEAEYYSFYVLLHLGCKIPKMVDSLSLWYGQLATPIRRSKEMIFATTLLRYYHLGNFKRFFCMVATEATNLQLCLVEPFLNEVRARALMYFNHSGYKLQHHPLEHLSGMLMIEASELEILCGICGLQISRSEGMKGFAPKQTSFSLPTFMPQSNGIFVSREIER
ncbi:SAC3 family protein C [Phragmites australis]|uniref:SAC3 family protein C n=1 Tax=Phragmites australis TaxID=29695 RepID=UPI002D78D65A|nr:SAC3 family protein C [Phragmites australis]